MAKSKRKGIYRILVIAPLTGEEFRVYGRLNKDNSYTPAAPVIGCGNCRPKNQFTDCTLRCVYSTELNFS